MGDLNSINAHRNQLTLLKDSQICTGTMLIIYLGLSIQNIWFSAVWYWLHNGQENNMMKSKAIPSFSRHKAHYKSCTSLRYSR